jgi:hypothetical protein
MRIELLGYVTAGSLLHKVEILILTVGRECSRVKVLGGCLMAEF